MADMDMVFNLKEIVFSFLFVSGDGIEKPFLAEKLEISEKEYVIGFTQKLIYTDNMD